MARFRSTIFGTISGRLGDAVAVTTKDGRSFLRVYTKPKDPTSPKQLAHQAKFGLVIKELSYLKEVFKITFDSQRGKDKAVSYAYKHCIKGEYPNFTLDYCKLLFTTGSLESAGDFKANALNANTLQLKWDNTIFTQSNQDDKLNIILFNATTKQCLFLQDIAERIDGINPTDIYRNYL